MKKLCILLAVIMAVCAIPAVILATPASAASPTDAAAGNGNIGLAVASDTDLYIDATYHINGKTDASDTYAGGYMPRTVSMAISIPLPLKTDTGVTNLDVTLDKTNSSSVVNPNNRIYQVGTLAAGASSLVSFPVYLTDEAYDGVYAAAFTCSYYDANGDYSIDTFTIFFQVYNHPEPTETPAPTVKPEGPSSMPRVMLTEYSVDKQDILAGEEATFMFKIQNMSAKRRTQNIEIVVANDTGALLPAEGTNSIYIAKLAPEEVYSFDLTFDVKPDVVPGPAALTVTINYEDAEINKGSETATISVLVNQPIRTRITDPRVNANTFDDPVVVSLDVYNLGKDKLYNLMADIKGDGFVPQSSYFGGTVEPGAKKTIELSATVQKGANAAEEPDSGDAPAIEPREGEVTDATGMMSKIAGMDSAVAVAVPIGGDDSYADGGYSSDGAQNTGSGKYYGTVVITYEDVSGKQYTEERPFEAALTEVYYQEMPDEEVFSDEPAAPNLLWLWITLPCLAVAGLVVFLVLRHKKRKKIIEDELL